MKVKNISQVQQRVEGFGYVDPGEVITVPEEAGRSLTKAKNSLFKKVNSTTQRKKVVKKKKATTPKRVTNPKSKTVETNTQPANDTGGEKL